MKFSINNELFKIGPLSVYGYGLMIAIGIIAAYQAGEYRAKKYNLEYERVFSITAWCATGGILGAKLLYYVTSIKEIIANPRMLLDVTEGFVVYGGIICGIFAGYLYARKYKLNFLRYFDLVMPSIALAQGFGRLGCQIAGCCYGIETRGFFYVEFTKSHYALRHAHLVPTQFISSMLNFLHFFILINFAKKKTGDGQVAGMYLALYSIGRFFMEFLRGDLERGSIGILSVSQFISIFLFVIGVVLIIARRGKNVDMSEPVEQAPANELK